MASTVSSLHTFSPAEGGLLYDFARWFGLPRGATALLALGGIAALITWVPLLILNAAEGASQGRTVTFWGNIAAHTRLLLVVPLYFLAEAAFNLRAQQALHVLVSGQVIPPQERPRLVGIVRSAIRWRNSWTVELVMFAAAAVAVWTGWRTDLPVSVSTWRTEADGSLTAAGWWYLTVSLPFFQFLGARWTLRLVMWSRLLWQINRLPLDLVPAHPDGAAGLGKFGVAHVTLAPLSFGLMAAMSASAAEAVLYNGARVDQFVLPLFAVGVAMTLLALAPLLIFMPSLIDARQHGVLEYGELADRYVRAFDRKWIHGERPPDQELLGSADVQSLADLSGSFDIVRGMWIIPVTLSQILMLVIAAVLPTLPLVLFVESIDELILHGLRYLVGL